MKILISGNGMESLRVRRDHITGCVFYAVFFQESPGELPYAAGKSEKTAHELQSISAETALEHPG